MTTRPAPPGVTGRVLITLSGIRQPIVAVLLLIVFFTIISGKPVDGLLLFTAATALAWDAGMRGREQGMAGDRDGDPRAVDAGRTARHVTAGGQDPAWPDQHSRSLGQHSASPGQHSGSPGQHSGSPGQHSAWRPRQARPPLRRLTLGAAAAVAYSVLVGSFTRMSWPATAGVVGLGAGVVIIGWGGPVREREIPRKFSRAGVIAWTTLLVAGGLWELAALLGQPTFEQSSYAHPTLSTLTDPMLASAPGRAIALLAWVALGAYLVER